jgi:Zn-dependent metalloprotease
VKKFLSITTVFVLALLAFGLLSNKTGAKKPIFAAGDSDELEKAKQISLGILRNRAAQSFVGSVDDFEVQKVEIDELKMAHTRVRQTVGKIPVWEGEAIVHLKEDGELSDITDELKENLAVNNRTEFSGGRRG